MYKKFDKVVPISKSTGLDWESSGTISRMKESGQGFLYFIEKRRDGIIICWDTEHCLGGDHFLEEDLIPYVEENQVELKPVFQVITIKELNDLVNKGILKEDDAFAVTRV